MTPKVKVKVKKEVMAKGEMTGKLYPKKKLDEIQTKMADNLDKLSGKGKYYKKK
jgi:hypothetical protein